MKKWAAPTLVLLIISVSVTHYLHGTSTPSLAVGLLAAASESFGSANLKAVRTQRTPLIKKALEKMQFSWGAPLFIRIFKESSELEVWLKKGETFALYKTFPICYFSGSLGPKTRQGDEQAPEGFYFVKKGQLNPNSRYHLSLNLGYPNAYDRAHKRTGDYLMIHGNCVSIGCYAMTNSGVEEIYLLAEAALAHGQDFFRVHAFPFRMSAEKMKTVQGHRWIGFWQELKQGYESFETSRLPPNVTVNRKRYQFSAPKRP